ncbi:MarR family transcriptional regulator [Actinomadura barringtoniae]|uniref:MarR family transcriptional regulator n=2 Tax=Actinomadura barringtoniae TaxID=1427535 RepID=A0A939T225_9ACTN|nr:MarR family transcriptional regulator [Actinomadura barringtoniae]
MVGIRLLVRRIRQTQTEDDLTLPESSALARLDRGGPSTAAELARREQISPQSISATLGRLEGRGLVERRTDPSDGRRVVLSVSPAGAEALNNRRNARTQLLTEALSEGFSPEELESLLAAAPLIERLAQKI